MIVMIEGDFLAHIKMEYILIKKQYGNDNRNMSDILGEYLENTYNVVKGESAIIIDNSQISYSFMNNKDDNRCFFTLSSEGRIDSSAKPLEHILNDIKRSGLLKHFHLLKVYDGLSEYYCNKLYPKYASYERNLRYMILLMVTKSYGEQWIKNTIVDDEIKSSISSKARSDFSKISMDEVLEYFDLSELENYLFVPQKIDIDNYLHNEFTDEKMEALDKEKICFLIKRVRDPKSLWERVFTEIGDISEWKASMHNIHDVRNSVAHHKKITTQQYNETVSKLKNINAKLDKAIESAISQEIELPKKIDILGNFATLAGRLLSESIDTELIGNLLISFSKRIGELVKPIENNFQESLVSAIKENALRYSAIDVTSGYKEALDKLANSLTWYDSVEYINNAMKSSREEFIKIGKSWQQPEIDAIGTAAKFENLAKQISSINDEKNTDSL